VTPPISASFCNTTLTKLSAHGATMVERRVG
jgi:hypothetical protein